MMQLSLQLMMIEMIQKNRLNLRSKLTMTNLKNKMNKRNLKSKRKVASPLILTAKRRTVVKLAVKKKPQPVNIFLKILWIYIYNSTRKKIFADFELSSIWIDEDSGEKSLDAADTDSKEDSGEVTNSKEEAAAGEYIIENSLNIYNSTMKEIFADFELLSVWIDEGSGEKSVDAETDQASEEKDGDDTDDDQQSGEADADSSKETNTDDDETADDSKETNETDKGDDEDDQDDQSSEANDEAPIKKRETEITAKSYPVDDLLLVCTIAHNNNLETTIFHFYWIFGSAGIRNSWKSTGQKSHRRNSSFERRRFCWEWRPW